MLVISMVIGLLNYFVARHREQVSLAKAGKLPKKRDSCFQFSRVFLVSWFPWLMLSLGNLGVSLLRDRGFQIFPWPLLANGMLLSLWLNLARRLRARYV